jgi:hypothetical protein
VSGCKGKTVAATEAQHPSTKSVVTCDVFQQSKNM